MLTKFRIPPGKEFVCSAKVAELMDILGVPDELDGTISMIQKWICPDL